MSVSVRVEDSAHGTAAPGVHVTLQLRDEAHRVGRDQPGRRGPLAGDAGDDRLATAGRTGEDGRLTLWSDRPLPVEGIYRLEFDLDDYFAILGIRPRYPTAVVDIRVNEPDSDVDLLLLITPNSYVTSADRL